MGRTGCQRVTEGEGRQGSSLGHRGRAGCQRLGEEGPHPTHCGLPSPGVYKKPQLSAVQGPPGAPWQETTLQCRSETWFDLFLLSQEGSATVTQSLRSQYERGFFRASFPQNTSEQARGATYRCYGARSSFPWLWSEPSRPLRLSGRGEPAWARALCRSHAAHCRLACGTSGTEGVTQSLWGQDRAHCGGSSPSKHQRAGLGRAAPGEGAP